MKIDLNQQYENADGTKAVVPVKGGGALETESLTLKSIIIQALLSDVNEDRQPVPSGEKIKRYDLYRNINRSRVGFILLSAEDIAFLKKVALVLPTLTAGQTQAMLETPFVEPIEAPAVEALPQMPEGGPAFA